MKKSITSLPVTEASALLASGELTSLELTEAYLANISRRDGEIGAYLTVTADAARSQAVEIDRRRKSGENMHRLAGIPMAYKDNIATAGVKTTCASRMLEDFVPCYNAAVVEKLSAAGCVMLGKLNMDEFAMGSSTENSAFKVTHNPRDTSRVPGGSSGGSAAAVAAELAAFTLGSDTGGSIRLPASFCGVVGIKPSYGCVSRWGLVAFASSLDQIGVLAKTVADSAVVLDCIAGHDSRDSTSDERGFDFSGTLSSAAGMKIGLPREFFGDGLSECVREVTTDAAAALEACGASTVPVSLPSLSDALSAYYIISGAEASSNLARFDGIRYGRRAENAADIGELYLRGRSEGFGSEVKRRIMTGSFVLSAGYIDAYYKKALAVRDAIKCEFEAIFNDCDCILAPVAPSPAFKIGAHDSDPTSMYLTDVYTVPVNIAGLPAISVPFGSGTCADGTIMPVGVQLIGRRFCEERLYAAAAALESMAKGNEKNETL